MVKERRRWKSFFTKENMIVCTLLGILLLVIAIPVGEHTEEKVKDESGISYTENDILNSTQDTDEVLETELEQRLASFLSCLEGAGEVKVMITFSSSEEKVVEKDMTVSGWQSQTGENTIPGSQETVFVTDSEKGSTPYVKKTLAACVEGVTVLAQGGASYEIQSQITGMIEALFGIEPHKIKVAKMK